MVPSELSLTVPIGKGVESFSWTMVHFDLTSLHQGVFITWNFIYIAPDKID